jgi:hypothetical protein
VAPTIGSNRTLRQAGLAALGCLLAVGVPCLSAWASAQWTQPTYSLTIASHLTGSGDAQSGSTVIALEYDGPVTIQASAASAGSEVLTSASHDTLTTSYKLTGAALGGTADNDWVPSATFVSPAKSYSVEGTGPSSEITLSVRAQTAAGRANDAGGYTASVVLTASW